MIGNWLTRRMQREANVTHLRVVGLTDADLGRLSAVGLDATLRDFESVRHLAQMGVPAHAIPAYVKAARTLSREGLMSTDRAEYSLAYAIALTGMEHDQVSALVNLIRVIKEDQ